MSNTIYAVGGNDPTGGIAFNTLLAYNPQTDSSWTVLAPMPTPRFNLAAAAVNGKIYAMGGAAVLVLRWKQPNLERPYKVWAYPFVPLLFVLMAAAIVLNTVFNDFKNSFWGLVVVLSGLPAYFYWSRKAKGGAR